MPHLHNTIYMYSYNYIVDEPMELETNRVLLLVINQVNYLHGIKDPGTLHIQFQVLQTLTYVCVH